MGIVSHAHGNHHRKTDLKSDSIPQTLYAEATKKQASMLAKLSIVIFCIVINNYSDFLYG